MELEGRGAACVLKDGQESVVDKVKKNFREIQCTYTWKPAGNTDSSHSGEGPGYLGKKMPLPNSRSLCGTGLKPSQPESRPPLL